MSQLSSPPVVSIVIVSMNKPDVLRICLDSIRQQNHDYSYETWVVAYLYQPSSLQQLRNDYPWVTFIQSNEIRGFSENNNLALRQARGRYCFVVNDDTEMKMPVIDRLVGHLEQLPQQVAVLSPVICHADGSIQYAGRNRFTMWNCIKLYFNLWSDAVGHYTHGQGLFQSYNILGAAFLIRTDIFREMGWFDEYYFFCPEDIALSTLLNHREYECWVDAETSIIHYEGMSGQSVSRIKEATQPAADIGTIRFIAQGSMLRKTLMRLCVTLACCLKIARYSLQIALRQEVEKRTVMRRSFLNVIRYIWSNKTPKQAFTECYQALHSPS